MIKRIYIIIPFLTILSVLAIAMLNKAENSSTNRIANGFNRHLITCSLEKKWKIDPQFNHIAGLDSTAIILCNNTPGMIKSVNRFSGNSRTVFYKLPYIKKLNRNFSTFYTNQKLEIVGGNVPILLRLKMNSDSMVFQTYSFKNTFNKYIPIKHNKFLYGCLDSSLQHRELHIINLQNNFCTSNGKVLNYYSTNSDGKLLFDKSCNEIIYIYFYRNSYLRIDTNLNLLMACQTIDTFKGRETKKLVKTGKRIKRENIIQSAASNRLSSISNGILYVNSTLKADNETNTDFDQNGVIDIYKISENKYKGSIYIPLHNKKKIDDFFVKDNYLYVLFKGELHMYRLNDSTLKLFQI